MKTVESDAFSMGQVICLHPSNSDFVFLFDGYTTVSAVASTPVRVGYWYNVYYDKGQFWVGAELPIRNS